MLGMLVAMMDVWVMRVAVGHSNMLVRMGMGLDTTPGKVVAVLMVLVMPMTVAVL